MKFCAVVKLYATLGQGICALQRIFSFSSDICRVVTTAVTINFAVTEKKRKTSSGLSATAEPLVELFAIKLYQGEQ